jgi:hypothetical protein
MLDRAQLPVPSAYIRKFARILSAETYAQDTGITHIAHCQRCRKATGSLEDIGDKGKKMWWCKRCRLAARTCVIWYVFPTLSTRQGPSADCPVGRPSRGYGWIADDVDMEVIRRVSAHITVCSHLRVSLILAVPSLSVSFRTSTYGTCAFGLGIGLGPILAGRVVRHAAYPLARWHRFDFRHGRSVHLARVVRVRYWPGATNGRHDGGARARTRGRQHHAGLECLPWGLRV